MGENDVEPLTSLELALEASYQRIRTRSIIESGAGVNAAASRLNMTFVASDPLSELVWSPHKGLCLKYTDFTFSDRTPLNFWDMEPSNMILSLSRGNSPCQTANKNPIIEENMTISQAGEQTQFAKSHKSSINLIPAIDPSCNHQSGKECEREVDLKLCSTSEPQQELLLSNSMPLSGKDKEMEIQKVKLLSRTGGEQTVLEEEKTDMPKFSNPENSTPIINQEFTAESGLWLLNDKIGSGKKESSPLDRRTKGKEKALSVGDFNDRMLQDENDSHGSVESCNSGGLLPKVKKRWTFEHQVIVESKRAKRDTQEIPASSYIPRQNSSFMNWISNVVKGPYNCGESDDLLPSPPLSLVNTSTIFGNYDQQIIVSTKEPEPEPASRTAGFQTMFQSIYCSTPKDNKKGESNDEEEVDGSKELMQVDNSHKPYSLLKGRSIASTSEVGEAPFNSENANINIVAASCAPEGVEDNVSTPERKLISWTTHKSDSLANLWISRFSPRAASLVVSNLDHQGQRPEKELECPLDQMKPIIEPPVDQLKLEQLVDKLDDDDDKSVHHFSNAPSSPNINSEAIASVFARRLVAIKHIFPLDAEIEESEIEIRRHQSPVRLNLKLDWKISSEKRESSSDERQKLASSSGADVLEPTRIIRLGGSTDMKHSNVPTGVFEFIKKLRLTRVDIFKWNNSGKSLSKLNGYFLRLRLGKKEGEQGGTAYHVAVISGEQKEGVQEGSKVSLSVVVGGARCWVESQYISNNNFLEEEFMVWWFSTMKGPKNILIEEDNLQFKVEERRRLGF